MDFKNSQMEIFDDTLKKKTFKKLNVETLGNRYHKKYKKHIYRSKGVFNVTVTSFITIDGFDSHNNCVDRCVL